jgi:hypothetical protein
MIYVRDLGLAFLTPLVIIDIAVPDAALVEVDQSESIKILVSSEDMSPFDIAVNDSSLVYVFV